jgi:hypothetical protein
MGKNNFKLISLAHGKVLTYNFNGTILHCYGSNDAMDDQVVIVEKDDQAVVIENPSFVDSRKELVQYIKNTGLNVIGKILSYHMAGGRFLPNMAAYSTQNAIDFAAHGAGAAMVEKFGKVFAGTFDTTVTKVDNIVKGKSLKLGDLHFEFIRTADAFDIEIVDVNVLYTHMLGHDVHSIVPSLELLDGMVQQLQYYGSRDYALILSAHHTPESDQDLQIKIGYLKQLQQIAAGAQSANDFTSKMKRTFPDYGGDHYLEMTAGFLFPKK